MHNAITKAVRLLPVVLVTLNSVAADEAFPAFEARTIDANIGNVCYAVTIADVDNDGLRDIVAVSENRVLWYQNPSWEARVIIEDQTPRDNVCIAAHDIDGDGLVDFALGAGWTKIGTLHWLSRGESLDEKWTVHSIGEELWLHRMRWADVLNTGTPQLVISPLNASAGPGVRLTAFEIPADPVNDRWPSTVLDNTMNRMHNHWHVDFDGDEVIDTLTASQEGVYLIRRNADGWSRTGLGKGTEPDDPPQRGAGEVKIGQIKDGPRFVTSVEPMHGHLVSVYLPPADDTGQLQRNVIDGGFVRGHALWTADIDGDGSDEIVFGHSDTPDTFGVIIYDVTDASGQKWQKHVIDSGGIATEDLIVEDLTGDGFPDIVAGGRATHNVKLYVQRR
ncbi:MAG: VCBS repeat-containing protein [Planctomycetaceae bacterium]